MKIFIRNGMRGGELGVCIEPETDFELELLKRLDDKTMETHMGRYTFNKSLSLCITQKALKKMEGVE